MKYLSFLATTISSIDVFLILLPIYTLSGKRVHIFHKNSSSLNDVKCRNVAVTVSCDVTTLLDLTSQS